MTSRRDQPLGPLDLYAERAGAGVVFRLGPHPDPGRLSRDLLDELVPFPEGCEAVAVDQRGRAFHFTDHWEPLPGFDPAQFGPAKPWPPR